MKITGIGKKNREAFGGLVGKLLPEQQALGLIEDGKAVGAAVVTVRPEAFILDFIYVAEAYRRRGGGSMLFYAALSVAEEMGVRQFLAFFEEDAQMADFLRGLDFAMFPSQRQYSFAAADLMLSAPAWRAMAKASRKAVLSCDLVTRSNRELLLQKLMAAGFDPSVLEKGAYDNDISFFSMDGLQADGVLLAKRDGDDIAITTLLHTSGNVGAPMGLLTAFMGAVGRDEVSSAQEVLPEKQARYMRMAIERAEPDLENFYKELYEKIPTNGRIRFVGDSESVLRLLRTLLPEGGLAEEPVIVSAVRAADENG